MGHYGFPLQGMQHCKIPMASHYKVCNTVRSLWLPITRYSTLLDHYGFPLQGMQTVRATVAAHYKVCRTVRPTIASHYKVCKTWTNYGYPVPITRHAELVDHNAKLQIAKCAELGCHYDFSMTVPHVTGNDQDYLRKIPRVVVQKSALL